MVNPSTRAAFTSTVWNAPATAKHSTNSAKFGGPNVNIRAGSKVQFAAGDLVWDVARVFSDGTLFLTSVSGGVRRTRKVLPGSKSWGKLWMVDGKYFSEGRANREAISVGGGPNKTIDPGNVVLIGNSPVKWVVTSIGKDRSVGLSSYNGTKMVHTIIRPGTKFWDSMFPVNG